MAAVPFLEAGFGVQPSSTGALAFRPGLATDSVDTGFEIAIALNASPNAVRPETTDCRQCPQHIQVAVSKLTTPDGFAVRTRSSTGAPHRKSKAHKSRIGGNISLFQSEPCASYALCSCSIMLLSWVKMPSVNHVMNGHTA